MTNEELLDEIKKDNAETRRHVSVIKEDLVKEVKTVAEGHSMLVQKIETEAKEIRKEMKEGFAETNAAIRHLAEKSEKHEDKLSRL